jgi:hypothetical protein
VNLSTKINNANAEDALPMPKSLLPMPIIYITNAEVALPIPKSLCLLVMSNQRSFKIESFRFAAFVPKKIECIRFGNKILDRNETFSISTKKFRSKSFRFVPFPNIFCDN